MGCHWRPKFQPFKDNAMVSKGTRLLQYTKGRSRVGTYFGGGGWGTNKMFFLSSPPPSFL
eukprot:14537404-Ditylum_brightwellii.AAC.1